MKRPLPGATGGLPMIYKRSPFRKYIATILVITMGFGPVLAEAANAQALKGPKLVAKEDPYGGRAAAQVLQDSHAEILALLKLEKKRLSDKAGGQEKISKDANERISELQELSRQADQDFSIELEDQLKELKRKNVSAEILKRYEDFREEYRTRKSEYFDSLDEVTRKSDKTSVEKAIRRLERSPRAKDEATEENTKTGKVENPSGLSRILLGFLNLFGSEAYAQPEDLEPATANEVEIFPSPEVKDLAASLQFNPYLLFQYVRDEIAYEPYSGTLKAPKQTLATEKANAVDQASLLMALYLASNIPTKFATGEIILPVEEVANWFGGIDVSTQDKKKALWHSLDEHGMNYEVESLNSRTASHVRLRDHVWVEAKVDYFPYRAKRQSGSAPEAHDGDADLWVALDPSFNQYSYDEKVDLSKALGLNSVEFLGLASRNGIDDSTPVGEATVSSVLEVKDGVISAKIESYRNSLLDYASALGVDLEDLFGKTVPNLPQLGVLPSSLHAAVDENFHQVISATDEREAFIAGQRHTLTIHVSDQETGESIVEYATDINLILDRDITLSYIPAETEDEEFLEAWQEPYAISPAALVNLNPVLRIGEKTIVGSTVTMGARQRVTVTLTEPGADPISADRLLTAGGYYALVVDSQHLSEESLLASSAYYRQVQEAVSAEDATATTTQSLGAILGQGLSLAGKAFLYQMDDYLEYVSEDLRLAAGRRPSVLLVGYDLKTTTVFGLPYRVFTESVSFDLLLDRYPAPSLAASLGGSARLEELTFKAAKALSNSALQGSTLDFFLEDETTGAQGLSALKLLVLANEQSIPIHAVSNQEELLTLGIQNPQIYLFASSKLAQGNTTLVFPESVVTAGEWTGFAYLAINPDTYATETGLMNAQELASYTIAPQRSRSVGLPEDPLWPADLVIPGEVERYMNFVNPVSRAGGLFAHAKNNIAWSYIPAIMTVSDWYGDRDNLDRALVHVAAAIALTGPVEETGKAPGLLYASMEPPLFDPSQSPGLEQQGKLRVYFDRQTDWGIEVRKKGAPNPVYPEPGDPVVEAPSDKILKSIPTAITGTGADGNYFCDGDCADGRYIVSVTAGLEVGGKFYSMRPWEEEFEIDTRAPELGLKLLPESAGSFTGPVTVLGKVADPHLSEWELFFERTDIPEPMQLLASGKTALNATGALTVWDTAKMNLRGDYQLTLAATDTLGHASTLTSEEYNFDNDNAPPVLTWNTAPPQGTVTAGFPISATARDQDSGLVRFELYLETEAGEFLLAEDQALRLYPLSGTRELEANVSITGMRIPYVPYDLTVRAVAEDFRGNVYTLEADVELDTHFWNVYAEPPVFDPVNAPPGSLESITRIRANKADTTASKVIIYDADDVGGTVIKELLTEIPRGSNPEAFMIEWDGTNTENVIQDTGHYVARLSTFDDLHPVDVDVWISSQFPTGQIQGPGPGAIVAVTEDIVEVTGYASYPLFWIEPQSFPLLDKPREIPRPFWKVEFKPHSLAPVYPLSGSQIPPAMEYVNSYDATHLNWTLINYGFHQVDPTGTLGEWDVSKLPDGFYDLRFVTADGFHYYEYVVVGLKVARSRPGGGGGERNLGTPGRNLLAETDMEIPLFGYDASIARGYDSYDTLAPGDFGYGWRMQKFGVGVERVELPNVRGEYEEVYITLPDGRDFFFANAPDQSNYTTHPPNTWEGDGYYAIHPYGMTLKRDGAGLLDDGDGSLAVLQNDDGTVYRFNWPDGSLIDVTSVEGNVVSFDNQGDTQYIEDSYQRQIKIERETVMVEGVGNVTRIKKIADPTGKHWFEYSYDSVNNLVEVAEKTANITRKKWFHYGQLEVDGDIVYYPIHYLTEMIEDTNGNGVEDDEDRRTTFAYDEEGRLEEVNSPAGTASLAYEDDYNGDEYQGGRQTVTDELTGAVTAIDHDISGNATQVQDPMGQTTTNEFYTEADDPNVAIPGALKSTTDPEGNVTEYEYDPDPLTTDPPAGMAAALNLMLTGGTVNPNGYLTSTIAQPIKIITNTVTTMENTLHLDEADAITGKLGKPITTTDAADITTSFTYDSNGGNLETVTRSGTEFVNTTYYTTGQFKGRVETETDQDGNITRYDYEIHPTGTSGYNQWVEVTTVTSHYERPNSNDHLISTTISDTLGRTLQSTNERGVTTRTKYDADGRAIETSTVYNGTTLSRTVNEYNPDGSIKQTTNYPKGATARTTKYFYDQVGRTICTVLPDGNWTATRNYPEKKPLEQPDGMDANIFAQVWGSPWPQGVDGWQGRATVSYDSDGKIEVSKQDLAGRSVESYTLAMDSDGHLQKRGSRTEYNAKGQAWRSYRVTGVDGADTETLLSSTYYDSDGRQDYIYSEIDGINTAEYGYDDVGRNIWTRAANGTYSTNAYDGDGRVVRTHSGLISEPTAESPYFDPDLNGASQFLIDIRALADETYIRYEFDPLGKITKEIAPNDDGSETTTFYSYDSEGRQTHIIYNYVDGNYNEGADGTDKDIVYETGYDKYGQRFATKDAAGHITWFLYDDFGRPFRKILDTNGDGDFPDLEGTPDFGDIYEEYTYDNARGLLTSKRNYDGTVISYEYDRLTDRRTQEIYEEDDLTIGYEYDSQGRLTSVVEEKDGNTRRTAMNYDPVTGQPSRIAKPEGTLNYSYNELGSLARVHESAGSGVDYEYYYDAAERLTTVQTPSGQTEYTYYPYGSRESQTLPNGAYTEYAYDNLLRTDIITHWQDDTESNKLAEFDYTVGQTGRRLAVDEEIDGTPVNIDYDYDGLGRLVNSDHSIGSSNDITYTYDVVGNRKTKTVDTSTTNYVYNALDQLETETPAVGSEIDYTYDDNGNIETRDDGTNLTTYLYDSSNRLSEVYNGVVSTANLWLAYAYDFTGNRVAKGEYAGGVTIAKTGFLIDDNNQTGHSQTFYEYNGNTGQINRLYEYGDDLTNEVDLSTQTPNYFVYDGLGTTRALTTPTAAIQESYNYTPLGEANAFDPGSSLTNHLFTGEAYDSDLELYYFRARMYDPAIGRFTSYDPVDDFNNKLHKYAYCGNDPVNSIDPTGSLTMAEVGGVVQTIIGTLGRAAIWGLSPARTIRTWVTRLAIKTLFATLPSLTIAFRHIGPAVDELIVFADAIEPFNQSLANKVWELIRLLKAKYGQVLALAVLSPKFAHLINPVASIVLTTSRLWHLNEQVSKAFEYMMDGVNYALAGHELRVYIEPKSMTEYAVGLMVGDMAPAREMKLINRLLGFSNDGPRANLGQILNSLERYGEVRYEYTHR
jgi:RHS repeat-associated protein